MSEFWIYFQIGLKHVLDIHAYDHVLFLIALTIPYAFKDWKRILLLISVFTIGHTLALLLSVFGIISIKVNIVEFLILVTILITAVFHLFTAGKAAKSESVNLIFFVTLFFGIIHGLGFSNGDDRQPLIGHDTSDIGVIQVDQRWLGDGLGNSPNCTGNHFISHHG